MSGEAESAEELNKALINAATLLHSFGCPWFVFYGTMLGLYRDDSCIDGDDDVDIMVNCDMFELKKFLGVAGFDIEGAVQKRTSEIIKTIRNDLQPYASVDFYFCKVNGNIWYSTWENTWIRDVKIEQIDFRGTKINVVNNPEKRLAQMYGRKWQTPIRGVKVGPHANIKG